MGTVRAGCLAPQLQGILRDTPPARPDRRRVAAAALQMYLAAAGAWMGGDDDSSLARIYAQLSGATLPAAAG